MRGQIWEYMLVIQELRRQRQEDYQFKVSLNYVARLQQKQMDFKRGDEYTTGQKSRQKGNSKIRIENWNVSGLHKDNYAFLTLKLY